MKLKEMKQGSWGEIGQYIDTALVPVMPLHSLDTLIDAEHATRLEQAAEVVEEGLKGRLLLWPVVTLYSDPHVSMAQLTKEFKEKGFKHVFFIGDFKFDGEDVHFIKIDILNQDLDFANCKESIVEKWSSFVS